MGRKEPAATRFWRKVRRGDECWIWLAGVGSTGYGVFRLDRQHGRSQAVYAHRYAYEQAIGPIPEGLVLDHLCGRKNCVNPEHLTPTTHAENVRRGGRPHSTIPPEFQQQTLFQQKELK